jgi:hypothetical protein
LEASILCNRPPLALLVLGRTPSSSSSPDPDKTTMITTFLTSVSTRFNPFLPQARTARLFLSLLPGNARAQGMKITTQLLPREAREPPKLSVQFSMWLAFSLRGLFSGSVFLLFVWSRFSLASCS